MKQVWTPVFGLLLLSACAPGSGGWEGSPQSLQQGAIGFASFFELGPKGAICANSYIESGIDVSDHDPNTNWTDIKGDKMTFAFIKATEGVTLVNPYFDGDWASTKTLGIIRGAYHYFHPDDDPVEQADDFLKVMGTLEPTDLPPMLDFEVTDNVAAAKAIQEALTWLEVVEKATGKTPVLYTFPTFWTQIGNPAEFGKYPLFIANVQEVCPLVPSTWKGWTFWQTGSAPMKGITAKTVDDDVFNGTVEQLEQFAETGSL